MLKQLAQDKDLTRRCKGRVLGDTFSDWDGNIDNLESDLNENPRLYFIFLAFELLLFTLTLSITTWQLILVTSEVFPQVTPWVWTFNVAALYLGWCIWFASCIATFGQLRFFANTWFVRCIIAQVPVLVRLAKLFGVSQDRLGSSCVSIANIMTGLRLNNNSCKRPVVLLPRCMDREIVMNVRKISIGFNCMFCHVSSYTMVCRKIQELRPSMVIAIACERDLMRGLVEHWHKIPVIGIANKRPIGPCAGATIDMERLRTVLEDIQARSLINDRN